MTLGRPAVFSPDPEADALAEGRLLRAAELAGFKRIRFLIEPIAAALAYEATLIARRAGAGGRLRRGHLGPHADAARARAGAARKIAAADVVASDGVHIGGDRFDAEIMRAQAAALLRRRLDLRGHAASGCRCRATSSASCSSWHEMSFIRERATQQLIDHMLHTSDNVPAIEALYDLVEENLGYRLFRAIEAAKIRLSQRRRDAHRVRRGAHPDSTSRSAAPSSSASPRRCSKRLDALRGRAARARAGCEPDAIDAVFLTGGSSQIPAVRRLFAAALWRGAAAHGRRVHQRRRRARPQRRIGGCRSPGLMCRCTLDDRQLH